MPVQFYKHRSLEEKIAFHNSARLIAMSGRVLRVSASSQEI
jgi:hypothetical protein